MGSFTKGTIQLVLSLLTVWSHDLDTTEHRAFPLQRPFWVTLASQLQAVIREFLLLPRSGVVRPAPTPGTASAGMSLALISTPTG